MWRFFLKVYYYSHTIPTSPGYCEIPPMWPTASSHPSLRPSPPPLSHCPNCRRLWQSREGEGGSGNIADGLVKFSAQNITEVKSQPLLIALNWEANIQNACTDNTAGITLLPFSFSWFIVCSAQNCTLSGRWDRRTFLWLVMERQDSTARVSKQQQ